MQTSIISSPSDKPDIYQQPSQHNHPPDLQRFVRGTGIAQMRKRVHDAPLQPLFAAYQSVIAESSKPRDLKVLLPEYKSVRTVLQRERSRDIPKLPKTKNDIKIEGNWSKTFDDEQFLLAHHNNEMLIFTTDANVKCLSECDTLYVDGTFKTCPGLFVQMYSIHGLYNERVIPLVFSLLSDKTCATYYLLFNKLRDAAAKLGLVLNPTCIMSDFESGLIEAVKMQFPQTQHFGCHFHFGQAVWRRCQETGIASDYTNNETVRSFVQKCIALAFIPQTEVVCVFDRLVNVLPDAEHVKLDPFIAYFRNTWLNGYSLILWNKYDTSYKNRTNNVVESFHSSLKRLLPTHPNIYVFVNALKKIHACAKLEIAKAACDASPPKRQRKYVKLEERLAKAFSKHKAKQIDTERLLATVQHYVNTTKH